MHITRRAAQRVAILLCMLCACYVIARSSASEDIQPETLRVFNDTSSDDILADQLDDNQLKALLSVIIEPPGAASPTHCDNLCSSDSDCVCDEACTPVACPGGSGTHKKCTKVQSAGRACCDVVKTCEDSECINYSSMQFMLNGILLQGYTSKQAISNHATYKVCSDSAGAKCANDKQQDCGVWEFYVSADCGMAPSNVEVPPPTPIHYWIPACETTTPQ